MLADAGADIIRIDRSDRATYPPNQEPHVDLMNRGRRSVAVDLKHPDGVALVLRLVEQADGLMEGFRPGVAERLGLGPEVCLARNPKLVYGRMTGWGQDGPMAQAAGHDIDYIALAGALEPMGRAGERPFPPLNLVGDFGGGGMLLAFGMVAAILSARTTGAGQVVDAAMVDGAASLMTMTYTLRSAGIWKDARGTNLLDTGAHFYEVYETSDGGYIGRRRHRAPVLRRADPPAGPGDEDLPDPDGPGRVAGDEGALRRHLRHQDPGRVGGGLRGQRRLRRPGAVAARGARPSPQPGPGHVHRGGRRGPAGPVAPVPGHPGADPAAAAQPGPARRRGPGRLGAGRARWPSCGRRAPSAETHLAGVRLRVPAAGHRGRPAQRLTTGQVTVRVIPSMSWIRPTTIRPSSSTVSASARTITS